MKTKTTILTLALVLFCSSLSFGSWLPNAAPADKEVTVSVFPNPVTNGSVSINSGLEISHIEIVSIVGHIVFSKELEPTKSVRLSLEGVESGIYLVRLSFINKTSKTHRLWVK